MDDLGLGLIISQFLKEDPMPPLVFQIFDLLGWFVRLLGLLVFGLGAGWFALEVFHKGEQAWQLQLAIFLGLAGLAIAGMHYLTPAALGAFGIGVGVAMFMWGMPKKKKEEK